MIGSNAFNYINILDRAADAGWTRNEVITNNMANISTPNYKRKDVQFESYLRAELAGGTDLNTSVSTIDLQALSPSIYVDNANLSYRMDGNNVNIDTESSELAKNQIRYYTLLDCMGQEFTRIKSVLSKN